MNESEKPNAIEEIKKALKELGVSFEVDEKAIKPFKVIYKPVNKSDKWYEKFEDIVDRYNLQRSVKQKVNEEMDYITVDVLIKLQNGDSFTTGFNISNKFLETQTPLEVAKKYYLGKPYTYSDETSSRIVSVELLDSEEEYAFYKKKS